MNDRIFSHFNQTETPEKVAEKRKRSRHELAVAPKVAAIVNLLL